MPYPLIVAHRGYSAAAPENTLAALRAALEAGAPACECDVRLSGDGRAVLMHDATVDRTTSASGPVASFTAAELAALDAGSWKSPQFAGEPVPTLAQALETVRGRALLVVEIKEDTAVAPAAADIRAAGAERDVVIISFSLDACRAARDALPRTAALWLVGGSPQDPDELADAALAAGLQGLDVHFGLIDRAADAVLRRGLSLWAWTVNDPATARHLSARGVAAITTDDPPAISAAVFGSGERGR